jgi:hypothetical protein
LYKDSLEYENSFPEATKVDVKDMFLDEWYIRQSFNHKGWGIDDEDFKWVCNLAETAYYEIHEVPAFVKLLEKTSTWKK